MRHNADRAQKPHDGRIAAYQTQGSGRLVFADKRQPLAWIECDPDAARDLEAMR